MYNNDFLLLNGVCGEDNYTRLHNVYNDITIDYAWCSGDSLREGVISSIKHSIDHSPVDLMMSDHAFCRTLFNIKSVIENDV